jgi:prepilin-type N-terminal cleavage/methylation domain-containing protein
MESTSKRQLTASAKCVPRSEPGFTLAELAIALAIIGVVTAVSVPTIKSAMSAYTLNSAVTSVTGAIQTARYRAVEAGYPFALVLNHATSNFQVQSDPTDTGSFVNAGNAVPFSSVVNILGTNTTFVFRPGGAVQCPQCSSNQVDVNGNWVLTVNYGNNPTETITVSPYGRVNVTP